MDVSPPTAQADELTHVPPRGAVVADPWRTPVGPAWRWLAVAIGPLALAYLALLNPYWVPSGDGEVYTAIARSLVKGEGLMFNGGRAAIAPPGWPIVLSLAMRVSPEFLFLKLVTTTSMLAALAIAFYVVRRFLSDRAAAVTILLAGTLSTLYPLTFWMHTEAFFCVLGFGAILIAFRIAEGRAVPVVESALMLALLAAGAFVRWPGLLQMVLVVPILLSGRDRPWASPKRWLLVIAVCVACVGTFRATYEYLSLTPEEQKIARRTGGTAEAEGGEVVTEVPSTTLPATVPVVIPDGTTLPTTTAPVVAMPAATATDDGETPTIGLDKSRKDRGKVAELANRTFNSGKWFSWLLWQPTRFGQSIDLINAAALVVGWATIGLLAATMAAGIVRRNYFWVGLAAYTGGLCVGWDNPNARYFVPVAPFIIAGVLIGIAQLNAFFDAKRWHRRADAGDEPSDFEATDRGTGRLRLIGGWKLAAGVFVASLLLGNLPLLAIDVWVFRSRDFYGRYEAGQNKELIAAAQFIRKYPTTNRIVISEFYKNMGRARWSKYGMRALHLLTDQPISGMQRRTKFADRGTEEDVKKELNRNNADYYVFQSEWKPWRVWHLRLTPGVQKALTGKAAFSSSSSGGWELYVKRPASTKFARQPIDADAFEPPRRVPGL
jgi:hypothetical protein